MVFISLELIKCIGRYLCLLLSWNLLKIELNGPYMNSFSLLQVVHNKDMRDYVTKISSFDTKLNCTI